MWFSLGLIVGVLSLALVAWMKNKNINFKWYDWVIGITIIVFGAMAIQHYTTSSYDGELKAGLLGSTIFGGLAAVLALVEWQLAVRRQS